MAYSVYNQLLDRIIQNGKGKLIFPADFIGLASSESIRKALSQLVKEKIVTRLGQGIYLYPEYDPELGMLNPSTEEIAEAVARQDKARIIPTGAQALYKLRLSQQVPMKLVYMTDGVRRTVKVGKNTITFRITTPKRLAARGKISALVIQALQALGKKQVDDTVIKQIKKALAKEDVNLLRHDAGLAPAWIATILFSLLKELSNDGMAETNG
jgi:Family of unknown function (DUF6088)